MCYYLVIVLYNFYYEFQNSHSSSLLNIEEANLNQFLELNNILLFLTSMCVKIIILI